MSNVVNQCVLVRRLGRRAVGFFRGSWLHFNCHCCCRNGRSCRHDLGLLRGPGARCRYLLVRTCPGLSRVRDPSVVSRRKRLHQFPALVHWQLQLAQVIQQRGLVIAYCFHRYLKSVSLVLEEFGAVLEATGREELEKTRRSTHCRLCGDGLVVVRGVANVFRRRRARRDPCRTR
eukprot:scaffold2348_cov66-Phaeocystis_antarctica.AAC.5